jgi:hypothetical protein
MDNVREIAAIVADLTKSVNEIQKKKEALTDATNKLAFASSEYDTAQINANGYRKELDHVLNLLVPESQQSRVRQSV